MNRLSLLSLLLVLFSCSSDFDDEWKRIPYESVHFNKLVVVGLSHDLDTRKFYEQEAASELEKAGFHAVKGLSIFPQEVTELDHNHDSITSLIIENQVDAVLTIKVLHKNDHAYLMPEDHKKFKVFLGRWGRSKSLHVNHYYKKPEKYYMIATLYNLMENHEENEETVIWRASSIIYNPEKNIEVKKDFIDNAVAHITDQHLIE